MREHKKNNPPRITKYIRGGEENKTYDCMCTNLILLYLFTAKPYHKKLYDRIESLSFNSTKHERYGETINPSKSLILRTQIRA